MPVGKVTLRNAIKFITHHQRNPKEFTVEKIAEEYKLPEEAVSEYHRKVFTFFF